MNKKKRRTHLASSRCQLWDHDVIVHLMAGEYALPHVGQLTYFLPFILSVDANDVLTEVFEDETVHCKQVELLKVFVQTQKDDPQILGLDPQQPLMSFLTRYELEKGWQTRKSYYPLNLFSIIKELFLFSLVSLSLCIYYLK